MIQVEQRYQSTRKFNNMPSLLQKEVVRHLQNGQFVIAKRIYDTWMNQQRIAFPVEN